MTSGRHDTTVCTSTAKKHWGGEWERVGGRFRALTVSMSTPSPTQQPQVATTTTGWIDGYRTWPPPESHHLLLFHRRPGRVGSYLTIRCAHPLPCRWYFRTRSPCSCITAKNSFHARARFLRLRCGISRPNLLLLLLAVLLLFWPRQSSPSSSSST